MHDARATQCILLGYLVAKRDITFVSRDVLFYEDHFPFSLTTSPSLSLPLSFPIDNPDITHPTKHHTPGIFTPIPAPPWKSS